MKSVDPPAGFADLYCPHNVRRDGSEGPCWQCEPGEPPASGNGNQPDDEAAELANHHARGNGNEPGPPPPKHEGQAQLSPQPRSTRLSDVQPERVRWLWPDRWPLGKLVTLDGDPDVGKSTLCLDIASRVTTGRPLPAEDLAAVPASAVVLMAAEDGLSDTIRPRLDAAEADVSRVHHLDAVTRFADDGTPVNEPPSLPGDIGALEALVTQTGAVLVIIDVLMAYLGGKSDSHRDQDMRRALMPLAEMADRTGACVVLLRHVPKSQRSAGNAISAGSGSIGIIGAARAGMIAAPDPDDETGTRRVLARAKGNLARPYPSLAYQLVSDDDRGCARVEWLGETSVTGDQLLTHRDDQDDDSTDASTVLADILDGGPVWVKQAIDRMAEAGFSKDQAKRAKRKLKVSSEKFGKPGDEDQGWKWVLPHPRRGHEGSEECGVRECTPFAPFGGFRAPFARGDVLTVGLPPGALRCTATAAKTGDRCRGWRAGTGDLCTVHGGTLDPSHPRPDPNPPTSINTPPATSGQPPTGETTP